MLAIVLALFTILNKKNNYGKEVDKIFEKLNNTNSPGCAVTVYKDGKVVCKKGHGMINLEYDIPINSKTLFNIAYVSNLQLLPFVYLKMKVNFHLMRIQENIYLMFLISAQKITIKQLLHHTSGLRNQDDLTSISGLTDEDVITQNRVQGLYHCKRI